MKIEKLFRNLSNNKDLIFYLFEHRDKTTSLGNIEVFCTQSTLEVLENFEIIELSEENVFLDGRVINFLENYLNIDENFEISLISEKIENLKHKIDILNEYKQRQNELIPQIRRELKKIDFILFQNLLKLRIHIDRVYKSADNFSLKIKELSYYKNKLAEFNKALDGLDKFLFLYQNRLHSFYNNELNSILELLKDNKVEINKSLIPLTQDVIEYINKAEKKNIFIDKITKLKDLKDSFEIRNNTNLLELMENFDLMDIPLQIRTRLDDEILQDENFKPLLEKLFDKTTLKSKKADSIKLYDKTIEKEFVDIFAFHRQFTASNLNLIEFLLQNNKLKNKSTDDICEIYCKMTLLYEDQYIIKDETFTHNNVTYRKIYHDNRTR